MISFTCCFIALVVGYFVYGKFIEKIAGVDPKRVTPAFTKQDGVDFFHDSVFEYRRTWADIRCYFGSQIWFCFFPLDRFG